MACRDIPPGKTSIQFFHEKIFAPLYSLVFLANFDTFYSLESENNFRGRLSRDMITLNGGQQETITVTDLVIPQGTKNGMELLLSLVVRKEDIFRRKRQVGGKFS